LGQGDLGQVSHHHHQQQQQEQGQQQQQQEGVAAMAAGWEWEPTDEQLEELSEQHIAAVAAAAAESSDPLLAGVEGKDAALCLMDYFVFKRWVAWIVHCSSVWSTVQCTVRWTTAVLGRDL
jgi:hypothetical protein